MGLHPVSVNILNRLWICYVWLKRQYFVKKVEVTDTSYRQFNTLLSNCLALQSGLVWYQMKLSNLRCSIKIFSNNAFSKACNGRCTAVGEPENAMKRRKALLSEEGLETKSTKWVRELLKHVNRLCTSRQEQNWTHMISINTYHVVVVQYQNIFKQCS